METYSKTCVECGKPFDADSATAQRCSDKCRRVGFKKRNPTLKATYSKRYREKVNAREGHTPGTRRNKEYQCVCKHCSAPFTSAQSVAEFCSHKCALQFRRHNPSASSRKVVKVRREKVCTECGVPFTAKTALAQTCSITCRMAEWRRLNPEKDKQIARRFRVNNKDKIRIWTTNRIRERYHAEPHYRLKRLLSAALLKIVKRQGLRNRKGKMSTLIGCSWLDLRRYIESMFRPGMSWANHGAVWQLDHIIPLASFNLCDEEQQRAASHYSNFQPLYKDENALKRDRIIPPSAYLRPGHQIPVPIVLELKC